MCAQRAVGHPEQRLHALAAESRAVAKEAVDVGINLMQQQEGARLCALVVHAIGGRCPFYIHSARFCGTSLHQAGARHQCMPVFIHTHNFTFRRMRAMCAPSVFLCCGVVRAHLASSPAARLWAVFRSWWSLPPSGLRLGSVHACVPCARNGQPLHYRLGAAESSGARFWSYILPGGNKCGILSAALRGCGG